VMVVNRARVKIDAAPPLLGAAEVPCAFFTVSGDVACKVSLLRSMVLAIVGYFPSGC